VKKATKRELIVVATMITNDRNLCVFRSDGVFGNHNLRFDICSRSLTKIKSAVRIVVALAFVAGCQNALRDTVPADIKRQFVDVA